MEHKAIADALTALSPAEAREAINTGNIYVGDQGSPAHMFALSLIEAKEVALRCANEAESLSISKEANSLARDAFRNSRRSNNIAISAMILSIATAIGIAIFQWLTKK